MRKLTQSEVIERFTAQDLEVLEHYKDSQTPILTRCIKCEHERRVYPHSVFVGCRCPKCAGQLRLTQSEAADRFKQRGLELIGIYKNNDFPVLVRCNTCKYERSIKPNFAGSTGCPKCAGQLPLTEAEVIERFAIKRVEMLEPYKDTQTVILVRCLVCKHERQARPNHIFRGCGCPRCSNVLPPMQSEVAARFNARGFEMLEPYKKSRTPILARCVKCKFEYRVAPNRDTGCRKCNRRGRSPLTQSAVMTRFNAQDLEMLEPYKESKELILTRCRKCNHKWRARLSSVSRGAGCPCCADYGFQPDKPATLYYLRVCNPFGEPVYKIGITKHPDLRRRFTGKNEFSRITVIETWHFESGAEAYEMEQDILNDYDADRWTGPDILARGNDELFTLDVLGLDKGTGQLELVA